MRYTQGLFAMVLLLSGCGGGAPDDQPDLGTVEGTVTMDTKPLENAVVTFEPIEGGRPSEGVTDADGKYNLKYSSTAEGAVPGKHRVRISTATTITVNGADVEVPESVPDKYNKETKLEYEVKAGSNEGVDFPLDSSGTISDDDSGGGNRRDPDTCS